MTNQELFSRVRKHLLTQNRKAWSSKLQTCRYRGDEGRTCAIGCLIPDSEYSTNFEGIRVFCLGHHKELGERIARAAGISPDQKDLAIALQNVHDDHFPPRWEGELREIAITYNLENK